jgi:hypothetical protein
MMVRFKWLNWLVQLWFALENPNWNVVLKTLMLTHRLLKDGNLRFMNELKFRPKGVSARPLSRHRHCRRPAQLGLCAQVRAVPRGEGQRLQGAQARV